MSSEPEGVRFEQILIEPAYRKVAAAIGERILSRTLREGERLPPETELARQFGVNRSTVREALRELESGGLVKRRPGSKLMSVSRPQHDVIAEGVSRALVMHDVTFLEVWSALTILEPPIAEAAARARTAEDLAAIAAAAERFVALNADTGLAVHHAAEFFRSVGRATHNQVLDAGAGTPAAASRAVAAGDDRQGCAGSLAHRHGPEADRRGVGSTGRRGRADVDGETHPRLPQRLRDR